MGCSALPGGAGTGSSMTLLEGLVALVILGLTAVGYLDVFQSGARSVQSAAEWSRAVAIAESAMEAAALGDALQAQEALGAPDARYSRQVVVRPWRGALSEVTVRVTSPRGSTFELRRLVRHHRPGQPQ